MAKIYPDVVGVLEGMVGNVACYVVEGQNMLRRRRMRRKRRRGKPMAEGNRAFQGAVWLGRGLIEVIRLGLEGVAGRGSAWNAFVGRNRGAVAWDEERRGWSVAWDAVVLADGDLDAPRVSATAEGTGWRFTWRAEREGFARRASDEVWVALLCRDGLRWFGLPRLLGRRGEDGDVVVDSPSWSEETRVAVFAREEGGPRASRSAWLA